MIVACLFNFRRLSQKILEQYGQYMKEDLLWLLNQSSKSIQQCLERLFWLSKKESRLNPSLRREWLSQKLLHVSNVEWMFWRSTLAVRVSTENNYLLEEIKNKEMDIAVCSFVIHPKRAALPHSFEVRNICPFLIAGCNKFCRRKSIWNIAASKKLHR